MPLRFLLRRNAKRFQGLKPDDYNGWAARLKPCPDTKRIYSPPHSMPGPRVLQVDPTVHRTVNHNDFNYLWLFPERCRTSS
jgi:hypothetical protein